MEGEWQKQPFIGTLAIGAIVQSTCLKVNEADLSHFRCVKLYSRQVYEVS
jgi:hypothetical protein